MIAILRYLTASGQDVFGEWLAELPDARTRAKIATRIDRLAAGNFGDCRPLKSGVWELKIDSGAGYRVYYGKVQRECVLLLCGGDKRTQKSDIHRAIENWHDYKLRTHRS
jgi:putative addiction module killer protein